MGNLIGREEYSNIQEMGQVYKATHDGAGNNLPYYGKVFISLSYGGKLIEDFGLIVVTDGSRIERSSYANFEDSVETYETLDGQKYWGTHFVANTLSLTLATDGMTLKQLDDFKNWFKPGVTRELILAEHPNRAIQARISEPPVYSFLPFEEKTTFKIDNFNYDVSTTLYKGEVKLNFVMDEPNWYAKLNYMPSYVDKVTLEKLEENSQIITKVETITDKDMLKIMYEDGIPHQSILIGDMFLGGNLLVTSEARTDSALVGQAYLGIITSNSDGLSLSGENPRYLFYSGTAKCYPKIKFSMKPVFDNDNRYITVPNNRIADPKGVAYSNISIGDKIFQFTTPSILTGYNTAIKIFSNIQENSNNSVVEVRDKIKEEIKERYSRAWAIKCLNDFENEKKNNSNDTSVIKIQSEDVEEIISQMRLFISENDSMTFTFDSKTGEAIGNFWISVDSQNNKKNIQENVGDMVRSDYLTIEGRNYLNLNGEIDLNNCHIISSNITLENVLIFYKNMYL